METAESQQKKSQRIGDVAREDIFAFEIPPKPKVSIPGSKIGPFCYFYIFRKVLSSQHNIYTHQHNASYTTPNQSISLSIASLSLSLSPPLLSPPSLSSSSSLSLTLGKLGKLLRADSLSSLHFRPILTAFRPFLCRFRHERR